MYNLIQETSTGPQSIWKDYSEDSKSNKTDDVFNVAELRKYEIEKLKYYYAIVECDSVNTASHLYAECDGLEFQRSSNLLDLRFIPDEFQLPDRDPREECFEITKNYKAPEFYTKALQHTKIELTWDQGDENRRRALTRAFTDEKMTDIDAYIGSASEGESGSDIAVSASGSEEEDGKVYLKKKARSKYASLLAALKPEVEKEEDLEITFVPGLKDLGKKILKDKEQKEV